MQIAKRKAEAVDEEQEVDSDLAVEGSNSDAESSVESPEELKVASTGSKKQKLDSVPTSGASSPSEKSKRKKSKSKRSKKQKIRNVKVAPQPS
jgi:hypothetical protein